MIVCIFSNTFFICEEDKIKIFFGMSLCERHLKKVHTLSGEKTVADSNWSHDMFEQVAEQDINEHMAHIKGVKP